MPTSPNNVASAQAGPDAASPSLDSTIPGSSQLTPKAQQEGTSGASRTQFAAGLDALENQPMPRRRFDWVGTFAPLGALLLLLGLWQLAVTLELKPRWVLPSPADVAESLGQAVGSGRAWEAVRVSLSRGLLGFALAVLVGTVLGLLIGQVKLMRQAFRPLLAAVQALPSVAWVPAAIIWFGLSDATIYAVVLLGAVPSIAIGLIGGLDQTPPLLHRTAQVLGANRFQEIRYVLLPAALPTYLTGLKQGWAFSWRSLMAAELIVQSPRLGLGLGNLLNQGRDLSDLPMVISAILLILAVGMAVELLLFAPLERRVLRNRGLVSTGL